MFDDAAGTDPMPMGVAVFLGILLISVGVLVFEVGRRSRSGTLARNWYVGIRTRATLASDENWEAAHRAGGGLLMIAAAGPVVGGHSAAGPVQRCRSDRDSRRARVAGWLCDRGRNPRSESDRRRRPDLKRRCRYVEPMARLRADVPWVMARSTS